MGILKHACGVAIVLGAIGCTAPANEGQEQPAAAAVGGLVATGGIGGAAGADESLATGGASVAGTMGGAAGTAGTAGQPSTGGAGSGSLDASLPIAGADAAVDADSGMQSDAGVDDDRCNVASLDPSQPPTVLTLSGALGTHDPVVIEAHGQYYAFNTGDRIPTKTSTDMLAWQDGPRVFDAKPAWIAQRVSGVDHLWAPDISFFGGQFHLYYSASTFGSNHSCIGHATRAALDAGSWSDQGPTICSTSDDDWNAIDPNVIVDRDGTPWLSFGSFWDGIMLVELDEAGARANEEVHALAGRGGGAIEAPFIVRRCGYYYLFVSFDRCCDGANSTYNLRVGRSESVTGPYVDREVTAMLDSGGTRIVEAAGRWRGPGHNAVLFTDTGAFNIYHSYDADRGGASTLRIAELAWDADGWPVSGGP